MCAWGRLCWWMEARLCKANMLENIRSSVNYRFRNTICFTRVSGHLSSRMQTLGSKWGHDWVGHRIALLGAAYRTVCIGLLTMYQDVFPIGLSPELPNLIYYISMIYDVPAWPVYQACSNIHRAEINSLIIKPEHDTMTRLKRLKTKKRVLKVTLLRFQWIGKV